MPPLRFARVDSPIGAFWVAETDAGVAACTRADAPDHFLAALRRRFGSEPEAADLSGAWLADALGGGPLPAADVTGLSAFDAAVYGVVRSVPPGSTLTYGEVAALAGSPGAARAVGGAMSRCPLFPAVPCHRVVRASDGWSGWGGDVSLKRRLLRAEHAALGAGPPVGVSGTSSPFWSAPGKGGEAHAASSPRLVRSGDVRGRSGR